MRICSRSLTIVQSVCQMFFGVKNVRATPSFGKKCDKSVTFCRKMCRCGLFCVLFFVQSHLCDILSLLFAIGTLLLYICIQFAFLPFLCRCGSRGARQVALKCRFLCRAGLLYLIE